MHLLVGLGNPGADYASHRHNVGFMAVDEIIRRHNFSERPKKFSSEVYEGRLGSEKCLVLKPQTFMNRSGQAVGEAARFYKIDIGNIIVLHDELDLAFGKIKAKTGGGAAGHNGLKSIAQHLGPDFIRVRIGISHPGDKAKVHSHVLGNFSKAEQAELPLQLDAIAKAASWLAAGDLPRFMTEVAKDLQPAKASKPDQDKQSSRKTDEAKIKGQAPDRDVIKTKEGPMASMLRALTGKKQD